MRLDAACSLDEWTEERSHLINLLNQRAGDAFDCLQLMLRCFVSDILDEIQRVLVRDHSPRRTENRHQECASDGPEQVKPQRRPLQKYRLNERYRQSCFIEPARGTFNSASRSRPNLVQEGPQYSQFFVNAESENSRSVLSVAICFLDFALVEPLSMVDRSGCHKRGNDRAYCFQRVPIDSRRLAKIDAHN